jgi:hypothetical protein
MGIKAVLVNNLYTRQSRVVLVPLVLNSNINITCFHNRWTHFPVKPLFTFNKMTVDYTTEMKFLGIQITDTLKWQSHIQLLASKLSKAAFMIKSLKEILSSNLIWNIYFKKFHSLLRFGILLWGGAGCELTTRILRIQKWVIRSMAGVSARTSCRQLFKELNNLTLVSLYILEVMLYKKTPPVCKAKLKYSYL